MKRRFYRLGASIMVCTLMGAGLSSCATANRNGRTQWVAPSSISNLYSAADKQWNLISVANAPPQCSSPACAQDYAFDMQIQRVGTRLAQSAFARYPALKARFNNFRFVVADKSEPGTASDSSGEVLIFSALDNWMLSDESIAFLIAREMGHVVAFHHEENTATTISFSILAKWVLFPASAVYSTIASFAGSRAMKASYRSEQWHEADSIALELLADQGWQAQGIAVTLPSGLLAGVDNTWATELRASVFRDEQAMLIKHAGDDLVTIAGGTVMESRQSIASPTVDFSTMLLASLDANDSLVPTLVALPAVVERRPTATPIQTKAVRVQLPASSLDFPASSATTHAPNVSRQYRPRERKLFVASTDARAILAPYLADLRRRLREQLNRAFPVSENQLSMVVTLSILPNGTLRNIEVDRGSGDSRIDKKVLSELKILGQLQALPVNDTIGVDVLGVTVRLPIG